jgi:hypothetical protein
VHVLSVLLLAAIGTRLTYGGDCIDYGDSIDMVASVSLPGSTQGVAVAGTYAYVTGFEHGLHAVDITDPASPAIVASVDTPGSKGLQQVSGDTVVSKN